MKTRVIFLFAITLLLNACGYHIVGYGQEKKTIYIESIRNTSTDLTINNVMEQNITRFMQNYGMLEAPDEADYIAQIVLTQKSITSAIVSSTQEALTSNMQLTYHIVVRDKQGAIKYNRSLTRDQNFATGADIKSYQQSEQGAFDELTKTIFTAFKYEFETS
ncbi:MAG: hypothetical protein LBV04_10165 [Deferribacteraceae bacterium]|jgi:outer membrane lipopolysaccharide assembly protein LptE/RlpB|nr:hypothetical protein [Deferribacteraceae bacterium]